MTDLTFRHMTRSEAEAWYGSDFAEAFAENERKPLADILAMVDVGRYELWGLFAGDRMAGYAALWRRKGIPLVLLDYLGVSADLRNRGLGADILSRLRAHGFPIVTESELPVVGDSDAENDLRRRRITFYQRSGFLPAYEMATCGMRWQALLTNADGLDLHDVMAWHRALYGPERTDVQVPIGPDETPAPPYWMINR